MRGLRTGHLPKRPRAARVQQGVPLEVFHVHGVPEAALHRRGAVHHGRSEVHL